MIKTRSSHQEAQSLEVERKKFEKIEAARKNRATALKELKGKRQGLEKALKAEESRVKGDPALEDDVARALEIVKSAKQMGKAKQLEEATRKVAVAQERLDKVKAKAPGAAGDATVYLRDQAPTGWKNAVEGISAQIAEIQKDAMELADLAKVNGGQVAKVIGDMAGKVLGEGVFASSFQGPIKELIAAPDQNKKKAAREKVIAEIGYLRKQLDSNPVLLQLRVNPEIVGPGPQTRASGWPAELSLVVAEFVDGIAPRRAIDFGREVSERRTRRTPRDVRSRENRRSFERAEGLASPR